jgi:hypothetical protein
VWAIKKEDYSLKSFSSGNVWRDKNKFVTDHLRFLRFTGRAALGGEPNRQSAPALE